MKCKTYTLTDRDRARKSQKSKQDEQGATYMLVSRDKEVKRSAGRKWNKIGADSLPGWQRQSNREVSR